MKTKMKHSTLPMNHRNGQYPWLAPSHRLIGSGARQPPRNNVVARAETVAMLMYSARKNSANFSEEYSVWKPPTSSPSASGRSNGARLVSPIMEMMNDGARIRPYQNLSCASTICEVDIDPAYRNTATNASPIDTS